MDTIHETVCPDCHRTVETNWDHHWSCPVALREAAQAAADWEQKLAARRDEAEPWERPESPR